MKQLLSDTGIGIYIMPRIFPFGFLCGLVALLLSGCGGQPECVHVSGKVLLDGKPVRAGAIHVVPRKERRAEGKIGPQGQFTLSTFQPGDGCVTGTHQVEVIGVEMLPNGEARWIVPKKYQQISTSGLTVDITGPTDDLVIDLKSDDPPPPLNAQESTEGNRATPKNK